MDAPAAIQSEQQAPAAGLTEAEAQQRLEAAGGVREAQSSRSYASIVRANVFTLFT